MTSIPVAKRCLIRGRSFLNHHRAPATCSVNEQLLCGSRNHVCGEHHPITLTRHPSSGLVRWQSNDSRLPPKYNIHTDNPFEILGIPKSSTYDTVKRRFLELALETHPDVVHKKKHGDEETKDPKRLAEDFVKLRQAFEAIRENSDGTARLAGDSEASSWSDESFQAWFHNETGHSDVMFNMDLQTRREVAEVASSQAQGGLDKGGMWEMARTMAEQQKNMGNLKKKHAHNQTQRVEAGRNKDGDNTRRRRRRK